MEVPGKNDFLIYTDHNNTVKLLRKPKDETRTVKYSAGTQSKCTFSNASLLCLSIPRTTSNCKSSSKGP